VNKELERMWKEAVVAQFKVLTRHLPGRTEEKTRKISVGIAGLRAKI
jgi:hypothetical protein